MHATYFFLADAPEEKSIFKSKDKKELFCWAEKTIEGAWGSNMDENNWYTVLAVQTQDHKIYGFEESEEVKKPEYSEWDDCIRTAAKILARDMELLGSSSFCFCGPDQVEAGRQFEQMTLSDLQALIREAAPKRLLELTQKLDNCSKNPEAATGLDSEDMLAWRIRKLSQQIYFFHNVTTFPFARPGTPYDDYRAIDLTEGEGLENTVIIEVDIHT